jgi:hypothetical protein
MGGMGTKRKARVIAGLLMGEVVVVAGGGAAVVGEGKMAGLDIIKEYLAVSFKQEGEHRIYKMSEYIRKLMERFWNYRCKYGDQCDFSHDINAY